MGGEDLGVPIEALSINKADNKTEALKANPTEASKGFLNGWGKKIVEKISDIPANKVIYPLLGINMIGALVAPHAVESGIGLASMATLILKAYADKKMGRGYNMGETYDAKTGKTTRYETKWK